MTEPTLELCDLAAKLVEHPRWKWEPGMVTTHHGDGNSGELVGSPGVVDFGGCREGRQRHGKTWWVTPDIEHPATKGWLLHMLRETTGKTIYVSQRVGHWAIFGANNTRASRGGDTLLAQAPTEGQALAAALLDARGPALEIL